MTERHAERKEGSSADDEADRRGGEGRQARGADERGWRDDGGRRTGASGDEASDREVVPAGAD